METVTAVPASQHMIPGNRATGRRFFIHLSVYWFTGVHIVEKTACLYIWFDKSLCQILYQWSIGAESNGTKGLRSSISEHTQKICAVLSGHFMDKPTRRQSSRGLGDSWISQLADSKF